MMLPENAERRNPQIFSDDDRIIADSVNEMKRHLSAINAETYGNGIYEKKFFDQKYELVVKKLDELGWKQQEQVD